MSNRKVYLSGVAILAWSMITSPVWAAGSVEKGKALAQQWCSNCHVIGKNQSDTVEGGTHGPDFMTIKGLDAAKLKARFSTPHPVMSGFPGLKDQDVDDLVAYIASVEN
jgi:mono/diheme cytochrome c family protein